MTFFRSVFFAALRLFGQSEMVRVGFTWNTGTTLWRDRRVDDRKLTEHFSIYELTRTNHADLQAENRILTSLQMEKLASLAKLLEQVRAILGTSITINSGYRCYALNQRVGSHSSSQHLRSEAADFVPQGVDLQTAFSLLRTAADSGKLAFGQLIYEKAERAYGTSEWLHISLGAPYRDASKSGEVLTMKDGAYHLIEQVKPGV